MINELPCRMRLYVIESLGPDGWEYAWLEGRYVFVACCSCQAREFIEWATSPERSKVAGYYPAEMVRVRAADSKCQAAFRFDIINGLTLENWEQYRT